MAEPELDMEKINSFRMPKAPPGIQVLWYRNGIRDKTRVEVAYMLNAGERTASIHAMMTGRRIDAVRHVDDPKLLLSNDQRENGAWDFTDDYKSFLDFKQQVEDRLQYLERQVVRMSADRLANKRPVGRPKKAEPVAKTEKVSPEVAEPISS